MTKLIKPTVTASSFKKTILLIVGAVVAALLALVLAGERVEIPPAHVGKIMTKDGYQEALIPTSKFRLSPCWAYCDRLVMLDVADKAYQENLSIFIPEDKLNLDVSVRATLSINPKKTAELFNTISPTDGRGSTSIIANEQVYRTYASQIIQAEVREYLSQYSISQIASSNEKINADLGLRLGKAIEARTPFSVRHVGITNLKYPDIEKEKAETEALAQATLAASVDSRVLELRKLENQRAWIEKWDGQLPTTVLGDAVPMVTLK